MCEIREAIPGEPIYISDLMHFIDFETNEPVKIRIDESVIYYTNPSKNRVHYITELELNDFIQKNPKTKINLSIRQ